MNLIDLNLMIIDCIRRIILSGIADLCRRSDSCQSILLFSITSVTIIYFIVNNRQYVRKVELIFVKNILHY